ncbi:MAG: preprotein translocase subunit YajC [Flavobacteriaceae bacterium]|nr:preprotein translocase subunit YajC [Flavobacteriaceae bacterium]|tara:strand:+ start:1104 stop:1379 length:276 start_codon:yes stop_codon:yes gene_type:complete
MDSSLVPLTLMLVGFFFLMIFPQMRRQKKEKKFLSELKVGSRVVTKSGLHGKIVEIKEGSDSCIIQTMAGKIRYEISAISLDLSAKVNNKK